MKVRRIRSHYERRVAPERESHEILDWGSRKDQEARFAVLARTNHEESERLLDLAQQDIDNRWNYYEQLAGVERSVTCVAAEPQAKSGGNGSKQAQTAEHATS